MSNASSKIKEEIVALIPPTLFFLVTLSVVAATRALMLKGTGIPLSSMVQIVIGALILGKAVVLADLLPFINRYPDKPLAYNIAWKTTIYALMATLIHYVERVIDNWKEAGGLVAAHEKMLADMVWPHFFAIEILLVVLIFNYVVLHEFIRTIGRDKALAMFFGTTHPVRA